MSSTIIIGHSGKTLLFLATLLVACAATVSAAGAGETTRIRLPEELRETLGDRADQVEAQLEEELVSRSFGPRAVAIVMSAVDPESLQRSLDNGTGRSAVRALAALIRETDVALRRGALPTRLAATAPEQARRALARAEHAGPQGSGGGRTNTAGGGRAEQALERAEDAARGAPPTNRPGGPPTDTGPPEDLPNDSPDDDSPEDSPDGPGDNPGDNPDDNPEGPPDNPGR